MSKVDKNIEAWTAVENYETSLDKVRAVENLKADLGLMFLKHLHSGELPEGINKEHFIQELYDSVDESLGDAIYEYEMCIEEWEETHDD